MLVCLASHACACATLAPQLHQAGEYVKAGAATPHLQKNFLSGSYENQRENFFGLDILLCLMYIILWL